MCTLVWVEVKGGARCCHDDGGRVSSPRVYLLFFVVDLWTAELGPLSCALEAALPIWSSRLWLHRLHQLLNFVTNEEVVGTGSSSIRPSEVEEWPTCPTDKLTDRPVTLQNSNNSSSSNNNNNNNNNNKKMTVETVSGSATGTGTKTMKRMIHFMVDWTVQQDATYRASSDSGTADTGSAKCRRRRLRCGVDFATVKDAASISCVGSIRWAPTGQSIDS